LALSLACFQEEEMTTTMTTTTTCLSGFANATLAKTDHEDDETYPDPWTGVCLLCWGVGDNTEKRIKWMHWMEGDERHSANLCKPCWKSLLTLLIGHNPGVSYEE
jgi:hypothetical protein